MPQCAGRAYTYIPIECILQDPPKKNLPAETTNHEPASVHVTKRNAYGNEGLINPADFCTPEKYR